MDTRSCRPRLRAGESPRTRDLPHGPAQAHPPCPGGAPGTTRCGSLGVDCAGASSAVSREGSPGPLGICRNPRASSPRPSSALLTRRRCRSPRSRPSEGRGQRLAESAPRLGRSVLNAPKPSTHPGFVKRRSPHAGSRALPHRNDPLIVTGGRSRRQETRGDRKAPDGRTTSGTCSLSGSLASRSRVWKMNARRQLVAKGPPRHGPPGAPFHLSPLRPEPRGPSLPPRSLLGR